MSTPRLILFTPSLEAATIADCVDRLAAAATHADFACVVAPSAHALGEAAIAPLLRFAAKHDIALLAVGATPQAVKPGFDGLHVDTGEGAIAEALKALKPDRIVGAGRLATRDEAMAAGEGGADYVMFGEDGDGRRAAALIAWWAEVMEPPCAGFANTIEDVVAFSAAGADFVALSPALWHSRESALAEVRVALEGQR